MFAKRPAWARGTTTFEGKRYGTAASWYGEGEVFSYDENRVVFKFRNESTPTHMMYGWTWLPTFFVSGADNAETFSFQRTRRFPRQVFEIRIGDNQVGEVIQTHLTYTGYEINLSNSKKWKLRLPLFTVGFFGVSLDGGRLLFWLKSHRHWQMVVDPEHDSNLLTASIAFIHREYLRHQ